MNRRALLGLFTIVAFAALFSVYFVLSDFANKTNGYRIGIRFTSAASMNPGALVYESGVVVGSVDTITLLPDYTSEVVIALKKTVQVPRNARFLIVQPLTGDPTLRIILRHSSDDTRLAAGPPLPHYVLPIEQQPRGESTLSLAEFLSQGQDQFSRIDALLEQFQTRGPRLMDALEGTLVSTRRLTVDADASIMKLSMDADRSLNALTGSSRELTEQLSSTLTAASANIIDLTARLDASAKGGQPHIDHIIKQLDLAASQLSGSVDALHGIASDPSLHQNVIATTRSLAQTTATFAALLNDLRSVTGDPRTQGQLRDTFAHFDAASQKADSLLGAVGGKSNVGGIDRAPDAVVAPPPAPAPAPSAVPSGITPLKASFHPATLLKSLVGVDVRLGELSPVHRDANGNALTTPILTGDRGPQTDITLIGAPHASTSYLLGANDIGASTTLTAAALKHQGALSYGGGILYSRLGVMAGVDSKNLGFETRIYDPRRGSVDVYGKLFASPDHHVSIFAGERDLTRDTRRDVFGVDVGF